MKIINTRTPICLTCKLLFFKYNRSNNQEVICGGHTADYKSCPAMSRHSESLHQRMLKKTFSSDSPHGFLCNSTTFPVLASVLVSCFQFGFNPPYFLPPFSKTFLRQMYNVYHLMLIRSLATSIALKKTDFGPFLKSSSTCWLGFSSSPVSYYSSFSAWRWRSFWQTSACFTQRPTSMLI